MASSHNGPSKKKDKSEVPGNYKERGGETNETVPRCLCNMPGARDVTENQSRILKQNEAENKTGQSNAVYLNATKRSAHATPGGYNMNGATVIKLSENKPGGIFRIHSNNDLVIQNSGSDIKVTSSQKPRHCINPGECARMRFLKANSDVDQATLENSLCDALASVNIARSLEEFEEMVEMHECSQLQQRLASLVEDKKRRLETRALRRNAELLERKSEFMRSVMNKICLEREEMSQMHNRLITLLQQDPTGENKSKQTAAEMSKFQPQAESTRMAPENDSPQVTVQYSRPSSSCQCKGKHN